MIFFFFFKPHPASYLAVYPAVILHFCVTSFLPLLPNPFLTSAVQPAPYLFCLSGTDWRSLLCLCSSNLRQFNKLSNHLSGLTENCKPRERPSHQAKASPSDDNHNCMSLTPHRGGAVISEGGLQLQPGVQGSTGRHVGGSGGLGPPRS